MSAAKKLSENKIKQIIVQHNGKKTEEKDDGVIPDEVSLARETKGNYYIQA